MAGQVLGIMGSPRKNGNTHVLMEKTLEGAREKGAITETLFLGDLTIQECTGCHVCWTTQECTRNDDMISIYHKIIASDIIIFGTPVYWYGPTALIKCFVDRLVYFNGELNRKGIRGKKAAIIIPFEENNPETVRPVITFFEKALQYLEIQLTAQLIVPGVSQRGEVVKQEQVIKEAYELGKTML